jgi:hypothetical protein
MSITRSRVLAYSGQWLVIDHYCDVHCRFLCYPEMRTVTCWSCHPEAIPPDYELHLEEIRKWARAKLARSARRPAPPPTDDEAGDDETLGGGR